MFDRTCTSCFNIGCHTEKCTIEVCCFVSKRVQGILQEICTSEDVGLVAQQYFMEVSGKVGNSYSLEMYSTVSPLKL